MDLDLGSRPTANVRVGADTYKMSVPTVKQSLRFSELLNSAKTDTKRTEVFMALLGQLGMPSEVVEDLSIHQMTQLAEGLMGTPEKK